MNRLTLAVLVLLAFPPTSTAVELNELPFKALPDRQPAGCLRPTGEGLAMFGEPASTDLLHAGERVRLGRLAQCASVAEAGGAAVVAGLVGRDTFAVRAAVREPGGAFGAPMRLAANAQDAAAAVSPDGHSAVAWIQARGEPISPFRPLRVMVARRPPGQGFGAPEPLTGWWNGDFGERVTVGIDASGTTTVAWTQAAGDFRARVGAAVGAAGSPFAVQRLATYSSLGSTSPALAVAPDGWALLAHDLDGEGIAVYQRAPGAVRFTRVVRTEAGLVDHDPAVAVGDGGGAVVAWRTGPADGDGGIAALTRTPGGTFTARETVAATRPSREFGRSFGVLIGVGSPPFDNDADRLRAAIGPSGRVALAWTTARRQGNFSRVRAATGMLGGSFDTARTLSTPVRDAEAPAPLFLADGRAAVAWVDNAGVRDGRMHMAVEQVPAPVSHAPRLTVRARSQRLFRSQPLALTARCDRPCDVEARVRGADPVSVTLPAAGTAELTVPRFALFQGRGARFGVLTVDARATEPGGRTIARRSLRVRVTRRPPLPLFTPLGVRAERRGDTIVVRWRTAGPARRTQFSLVGSHGRRLRTYIPGAFAVAHGRGRTRFVARMRPERPRRVRWVTVSASSPDGGPSRSVVVPVQ